MNGYQEEYHASTSYATLGVNAGHTHSGTQDADFFTGQMDEVSIWHVARSEAENGMNQFVKADSISNDLTPAAAYSLSAWVLPAPSSGPDKALLAINTQSGGDRQMVYFAYGDGTFYYDDGSAVHSQNRFDTGRWHHVALTVGLAGSNGNSTGKLYVDGTLEATFTVAASARPHLGDLFSIGQEWDSGTNGVLVAGDFWTGQIDEVRAWTVERTQAQIQADMAGTASGTEAGLVGYWPFADSAGSQTAQDVAAADYAGTVQGGAVRTDSTAPTGPNPQHKFDMALSFDGSDDNVQLAAAPLNNLANWTFTAWVRPTTSSGGEIYSEGNPNSTLPELLTYPDAEMSGFTTITVVFSQVVRTLPTRPTVHGV